MIDVMDLRRNIRGYGNIVSVDIIVCLKVVLYSNEYLAYLLFDFTSYRYFDYVFIFLRTIWCANSQSTRNV